MKQLDYSCDSAASPAAMDQIMDAYLSARAATPALVQALLKADPNMPMAHCAQAYFLKLAAHPKFLSPLLEHQRKMNEVPLNPRERLHATALAAWIEDDVVAAITALEAITDEHPLDLLALRIAHYLHFYNGAGGAMHASTAKVIDRWDKDDPHYGYLLGMHAFGLEEDAQYHSALELAESAVARNAQDTWAIHAADHVYYMTDRHAAGIEWLEASRGALEGANNFAHHLHWHEALHHLKLEQVDGAVAIYDSIIEPSLADDFYLDFCNAVGLLVRLEQHGIETQDRWDQLTALAQAHLDDRELVFASLHYLIALLRAQPARDGETLAALAAWAESSGHQANISGVTALPLMQAIIERQKTVVTNEDAERGFSIDLTPLGGSKAQRELFSALI